MARFMVDVPTGYTPQEIDGIISQFAQVEDFEFLEYRGENIFKKGKGWLTAPQCLKVEVQNGWVHIEAWLATLLIPGVHLGEMDLEGFYGVVIKNAFRNKLESLIQIIAAKPPMNAPVPQAQPTPQSGI